MSRAAIYMRVSSVGQEENYSLPGQEEDCHSFAAKNGHEVVLVFNDGAQKSFTLDRPGITDLISAAKAGEFELLIVGKYDRLSRVQIQQQALIYQLSKYGVEVVSAKEPLPSGPTGDLLRSTYAFAAEIELLNIRQRTTGGRKRRVRAGKLLTGATPLYGYLWANADVKHGKDAYLIDPETAPVVKLIYDLVLQGMTLRGVAAELEARAIPTPGQILERRGQLPRRRTVSNIWRLSTLVRILSNPAYMGRHAGWRRSMEELRVRDPMSGELLSRKRVKFLPLDDPDRVDYDETVCPAIVDEAAFLGVQAVLQRNKQEAARRMLDPEAALLRNGFARCGHCGRSMQAKYHKSNGHYRYWCASERDVKAVQCPGGQWSLKVEDLDADVWNWIIEAFKRPEIIRQAFDDWKIGQAGGRSFEHDRLESIGRAMADARTKWRNCMNSAAQSQDDATRAYFTKLADDTSKELKGYQREYDSLSEALGKADVQVEQVENMIALGAHAVNKLEGADFHDKRTFLYALGVVVTVKGKGDYKVGWKFDHLYDEAVQKQLNVPNRCWMGTQKLPTITWSSRQMRKILASYRTSAVSA